MSDYNDLVRGLRNDSYKAHLTWDSYYPIAFTEQVATAIETLAAERDEARKALRIYDDLALIATFADTGKLIDALKAANEKANAALRYGSVGKEVRHAVTCQRFPDPYDERDAGPDVPCTCGAKEGKNG